MNLARTLSFFTILILVVIFIVISMMSDGKNRRIKYFKPTLTTAESKLIDSSWASVKEEDGEVSQDNDLSISFTTAQLEVETSKHTQQLFTTSSTQIKTSKRISTRILPTQRPINYNLNRTLCNVNLHNKAVMCPPLYTSLGGKCEYNNLNIVCTDVRGLSEYRIRQGQLVIARLLDSFDVVARKHGIKYWLTSGTLLGAVRHKGFIPWDDDADIEMTLDEYEKFYRYASKDLPNDVFFQNSESDPYLRPSDPEEYMREKYKDIGLYKRTYNPRLRDRKSCYQYCLAYGCKWHDGAMLDIFVVESIPNGSYPLNVALFEGLHLPVQNNWQDQLTTNYGEDFMIIPQKKSNFEALYVDPEHGCEEFKK